MPGADASQFTAMRRFSNQAAPPRKGKDPHYQVPIMASSVALGLTGFLPSLRKGNVANFYVNGRLSFTYGVVTNPVGDYTAIIAAIAQSYGVDPSAVTIKIESGSIILNFSVYYGTIPPTIPTNASFIAAATSAILSNGITNLTFNGPATSTTLTTTSNLSGTISTQVNATSLFNLLQTSGVSLPSRQAFSCAFDNAGNYFLTYLHKIYKVTPNGVISLFAGSDDYGYADGTGSDAQFYFAPSGDYGGEIAVDSANNLYVADTFNHRIRMITPDGVVSTLAGSGQDQFDTDGVGGAADISSPLGITMGPSGNLYVSSLGNHIRKINIERQDVTTLDVRSVNPIYKYVSLKYDINRDSLYALDYNGSSNINVVYLIKSRADDILNFQPTSLVKDSVGNFYVADTYNHKIKKIDTSGNVTTFAGSSQGYTGGQGTTVQFSYPQGITIDSSDNLYVADSGNNRIRKIDTSGNVTTIAGSIIGYTDGQGETTRFGHPLGITIDSVGNLYVADTGNNRIRKITPSGNVTTIAGSSRGYVNGQGTAVQFNYPYGITIDSSDNLYVADSFNNRIRKIDTSGYVTTFAGSTNGYADGQGSAAQFNIPNAITIDSSGNFYVCDFYNHRIRKITQSGLVSTFAGSIQGFSNGQGETARFSNPNGITIDSVGNLYVADFSNQRIRKIDIYANVTNYGPSYFSGEVFAGYFGTPPTPPTEINGYRTDAQFQSIDRIEIDSRGNLYLSETPYRRIRFIDSSGYVSTLIKDDFTIPPGTTSPGLIVPSIISVPKTGSTKLRYQIPTGEIYDFSPEANSLPINHIAMVTTIAGSIQGYADGQGTAAQFSYVYGITIDLSGNLYVADTYGNNKIRKIDNSGNVTTIAGSIQGYADGQGTAALFYHPFAITIDSVGNLYVADSLNNRIRKIDIFRNVTTIAGSIQGYADGQGTAALFYKPNAIAIDSVGNLYVVDSFNNRIRKIDTSGNVTTIAGSIQGYADGQGTAALFYNPCGITIDSSGNLYVADSENHKIRKIDTSRNVTTIAGSSRGYADGQGTAALFYNPYGITIDSSGNLYVTEGANHTIRKIDTSRNVTTIAGSSRGYADGPGTAALFSIPSGITIDSSGNLYVADSQNNRIRKITFI
jgi:sugar lactone lactonase YvrE